MTKDYYPYLHLNSSITTITEFISVDNSWARYFIGKEEEFLNYADEDGITNRDRVWGQYTLEVENYPTAASITLNSPLNTGTLLYIPKDQANNEIISFKGVNQILNQKDVGFFWDNRILDLTDDLTYAKVDEIKMLFDKTTIKSLALSAQVWVWVKSLDKILNITPFLLNLNTNVTEGGGKFNLSLTPKHLEENDYQTNKNHINYFQIFQGGDFDTSFFFNKIQQNDVMFIRYEKLGVEKKRDIYVDQLEIPKSALPDQIYDMIGLVDEVSLSYSANINNLPISITGRDFTKLLVEDGSYFYPFALMENGGEFFVNTSDDDKFIKRLFIDSGYRTLFSYSFRSISDTLSFIFNQLSNTGVIPNNMKLFDSYPKDKIAKVKRVSGVEESVLKEVEVNGVWKIIKLLIDEDINNRRVSNADITNPDGTLLEQINKVCQKPFVEFFGDTYGDTYTFVVRQPPFTKKAILEYINKHILLEVKSEDVVRFDLEWETEYYSMYQIQAPNSFLGSSNYVAMAQVPVVYFPTYINTFGNHKKVVPSNYISYQAIKGVSGAKNRDLFRAAIIEDFKYIIETSFYLPFTRRGSITISGGDRRIKRGMWVYLESTKEIAYVDSVSNNLTAGENLNRTTTINVSRCMIKEFVTFNNNTKPNKTTNQSEDLDIKYNYFDVIDTDFIGKKILHKFENREVDEIETKFILNEDAFNFFLKRKQLK